MSADIKTTHTFHASRELVFKALTDAEHVKNWWGPKGWIFEVSKADFSPGGIFLYSQKPVDGEPMWVKFVYKELLAPEKIVYSSFFSDEAGNPVRAPFDAHYPLEILNTMTLTEVAGKTTLTMMVTPVSPTEEEWRAFEATKEMAQGGYKGTFVQLDEYLEKMEA
ncbi:SRPBCC family protein [Bacillus tuaregi]|uniref:SRPBCC family protein n=1 Tax=Bacillus tuaregi TaxID=1816695 RepID=UPI0008F7EC3C|nr:SRPBCC domain-containing protein [Bacillus tuaregi]